MSYRGARLKATAAANKLHRRLRLLDQVRNGLGPIDVYRSILDLDLPIMFRPLEGVLGVYLTSPSPGILISDALTPARQRYTAAHELGHYFLGHEESIDDETSIPRGAVIPADVPLYELEAEAFASEFLMPKALIVKTSKRMGLDARSITVPTNVYQLSLRLATSYQATCFALKNNTIINSHQLDTLISKTPKQIKQEYLQDDLEPHADVLLLNEKDHGRKILLKPSDRVVLSLTEHTTSGYQWSIIESGPSIDWIEDVRQSDTSKEFFGTPAQRKFTFSGDERTNLKLSESRAWQADSETNELILDIDFRGPEHGFPRLSLERL